MRRAQEWWAKVTPWLNYLIKFLKFGVPMGKAIGAVYDEKAIDQMKANIGLLEEMTKNLPQMPALDALKPIASQPQLAQEEQAVGAALRALYSFLKEVDPSQTWGGLCRR